MFPKDQRKPPREGGHPQREATFGETGSLQTIVFVACQGAELKRLGSTPGLHL